MFFPDPAAAVSEMVRVTRPGGSVVLQTWGPSSAYEMLAEIFDEVASPDAAAIIRAPFAIQEMETVRDLASDAGLAIEEARTHWDVAEYESIGGFVGTEIMASPLATMVDPDLVLAVAEPLMKPFEQVSGEAILPLSGHFVRGRVS